ncbi:Guanylate-kinase-associated protein-like protein [Euroglyphus maynei]|uniref:Guanylate-kinase-associated protein-like protein n=1 Tax=Euroglyphus maynei TaxID=6958 RepID=A0A1Y3B9S0_EURMA|nr:Guanylate-kinase-associated protein-like protein [Euroglyphus maynei]
MRKDIITINGDNTQIQQLDPVKGKIEQTVDDKLIIYSTSELSTDSHNINTHREQYSISFSNFHHSPDHNQESTTMIANQQNNHFESQNSQQNQPSYVNISRVNHGYVPYNRYTSEYRRDDSLLRYPVEDRFTSLPAGSSKGFLQKKVESLYGESFAEDWNKSRVKKDWWLREHQPQSHKTHDRPDGRAFSDKIQEQKARIQNKIQQGEKWLANPKDIPEECIGKIRAAIGKANLLLDKKFQQFQKLCEDSINQTDGQPFKIESDDLQGFWDMVMIQVVDVNQTFDELVQSKQNQWKPLQQLDRIDSNYKTMSPKISTRQPSTNMTIHDATLFKSSSSSPKKYDTNNNKTAANMNSPRDEERQRRLIEIKRRGKMIMKQEDSDEIRIFAPSK